MDDGRRSRWSLGRHLVVLVVLLAVVWPLLERDADFISDEGSYALQARVLREGDWDMGYPYVAADPEVSYPTYHAARVTDGRIVPYVDHPLWPRVLASVSDAVGEAVGLRLVGVASLVALAALAWLLAADLAPGREPWAFWMAATSAALAHAWMLWAHAPSAALGGLLVLAALRWDRRAGWLAVAAVAAALGVLLRAEGMLWAVAVGLGALLVRRDVRSLVGLALIGIGTGGGHLLENEWIAGITGTSGGGESLEPRRADAGYLDRLGGLRRILVDGAFSSESAKLIGLGAVLAAGTALVLLARRSERAAAIALVAAAGAVLLRLAVAPEDPAPGLLVVAPSLVLAGAAWTRRASQAVSVVTAAVLLFLGAMAVSIYPDGGSFQWGGRFLSPSLAGFAALAAVAVPLPHGSATSARSPVVSALAVLLVAQAVASLVGPDNVRRAAEHPFDEVVALGPDVFIASDAQLARFDWRGWPDRCWIGLPDGADRAEAQELLEILARSGIEEAVYVRFEPDEVERAGGRVVVTLPAATAGVVRVPAADDDVEIAEPYRCGR